VAALSQERGTHRARGALASLVAIAVLAGLTGARGSGPARAATRTDVRILMGTPSTLDPAAQSDIGSARIASALFESLTAFDAGLVLRPALASGWDVSADGRQVVFHLRPNLTFSDGSPLGAGDVVRSWLRLIDPAAPSPLSTLILEVHGAREHLAGSATDPADVGIRASGSDVIVDLDRPGSDFPTIVASPSFEVVPAFDCPASERVLGVCDVFSGGYRLTASSEAELTLTANDRYWAGKPAIQTVHLLGDIGGRSPVAAFAAGDLDYTPIAANDASWIRYDATLGPQLRSVPQLSLTYLGFDTSRPPFDDVNVRRAIGAAVDWKRIVKLGTFGGEVAAGSMVPPGVPGGGTGDWLPVHDPAAARTLLATAGYPGGAGFPEVTFGTGGAALARGLAAELKRELGITIELEEYADHFSRLGEDPPGIWTLGWIADYPGANDFLGVLLGSDGSGNYGHWSSAGFDEAIGEALSSRDATAARASFEKALGLVQADVPAVPLAYGDGWALSRTGLLGAGENGLGLLRVAGLAWAP
jgi:oligopeptide transport system substrate-binding protein